MKISREWNIWFSSDSVWQTERLMFTTAGKAV